MPGLLPHPTVDARGHSYGVPEPEVPHLPPQDWRRNGEYLFGVDLFNHRYYWEAHEAWERVWHTCDKGRTQGLFVQGLIQLSAALLKWHMGAERGTRLLYAAALEKLEPARREAPQGYMGIPVRTWLAEVAVLFAPLLARAGPADAPLPVIRLQDEAA